MYVCNMYTCVSLAKDFPKFKFDQIWLGQIPTR